MKKIRICKGCLLFTVLLITALVVTGCSGKKGGKEKDESKSNAKSSVMDTSKEPTFEKTLSSLNKNKQSAASSAKFTVEGITHISDNPNYFKVQDNAPVSEQSKGLDAVIRPVLVKLFGGAKLVSENEPETEKRFVDDVINRTIYVVRRLMADEDVDDLHAAFVADNFGLSPRLGARPQGCMMSLFKYANKVQYSLTITMDLQKQTIKVESHKLGSKYDRL